ncbi:hypothetical protein [Arthrobacter sp. UNC362MFTsu5.1]|uniref:hypothetical protein n=1 Tax=Arthrobacter sp. UNC362MFTsu5.1 TaxID=1449044 RepID=UPI001E2F9AE9|nr:hypothetical protein [Arthrobacter sp. UNC362MFTsu5.1]
MTTPIMAVLILLIGVLTAGCAAQSAPSPSASASPSSASAQALPAKPKASPSPSTTPAAAPVEEPAPAAVSAPEPAAAAPAPVAVAAAVPAAAPATSKYPLHTNVVSTTFWVGEIFNASLADGSQVCSTYNGQWAFQHTGINAGTTPASASGCPGSIYGGCDGVSSGTGASFTCATEARDASNGYFPKNQPAPLENPFYLDLPYDDINNAAAFRERATVIPWANDEGYKGQATNRSFSYMKNRWVKIRKDGKECYGQIQDAGPGEYQDKEYVFGANDARPANKKFNGAGMDVSPALNGCLGFSTLNGEADKVDWQFVDQKDVPPGPWLDVVTPPPV